MEKLKFLCTAVGTVTTYLLGGFDDVLIFLALVMCLDYITGVLKGYYNKEVSSRTGYKGIIKKSLIIVVLIIAVQFDRTVGLGEPIFRTSVCWFFIANETISIFENCGAMGLKIPKKLRVAFEQIKAKDEEGEEVCK